MGISVSRLRSATPPLCQWPAVTHSSCNIWHTASVTRERNICFTFGLPNVAQIGYYLGTESKTTFYTLSTRTTRSVTAASWQPEPVLSHSQAEHEKATH